MRHYKAVINQEWLPASSPHEVANFLEKLAGKLDDIGFGKNVDKELEFALLERNNSFN